MLENGDAHSIVSFSCCINNNKQTEVILAERKESV